MSGEKQVWLLFRFWADNDDYSCKPSHRIYDGSTVTKCSAPSTPSNGCASSSQGANTLTVDFAPWSLQRKYPTPSPSPSQLLEGEGSGIIHRTIDLSNSDGKWVTETQAHTVGGRYFSTASATVVDRKVTISQTQCAEARAYVSLGKLEGNVSFSYNVSVSKTKSYTQQFHVYLVAGQDLTNTTRLVGHSWGVTARRSHTLRALGLQGDQQVWVLIRSWAYNTDYYGCRPSHLIYNTVPGPPKCGSNSWCSYGDHGTGVMTVDFASWSLQV